MQGLVEVLLQRQHSSVVVAVVGHAETTVPRAVRGAMFLEIAEAIAAGDSVDDDRHPGLVIGLPGKALRVPDPVFGEVADVEWKRVMALVRRGQPTVVGEAFDVDGIASAVAGGVRGGVVFWRLEGPEEHVQSREQVGGRACCEGVDRGFEPTIESSIPPSLSGDPGTLMHPVVGFVAGVMSKVGNLAARSLTSSVISSDEAEVPIAKGQKRCRPPLVEKSVTTTPPQDVSQAAAASRSALTRSVP